MPNQITIDGVTFDLPDFLAEPPPMPTPNYVHCATCNCKMDTWRDPMLTYEGKRYCYTCRDRDFTRCEVIGFWCLPSDITEIDGKKVWRRLCESHGYIVQCHNDEWHLSFNCVEGPDGKWYLRSEFEQTWFSCPDCGETHLRRDGTLHFNQLVCHSCDRHYLYACCECAALERVPHRFNIPLPNGGVGSLCRQCRQTYGVAGHNYKPAPKFRLAAGQVQTPKTLFMGCEIEAECDDQHKDLTDDARTVNKNFDKLFYVKHDGSLRHGFECVSHPMTWEFINSPAGNAALTGLLTLLRERGYTSFHNPSCGLHIHATRAAYTPLQIYKLQRFIFGNQDFIHRISRRTKGQLSGYAKLFQMPILPAFRMKQNVQDTDRYKALNLCNSGTIEFRLFKGSLAEEDFFRAFEFVHALTQFTREHKVADMTADAFTAWINRHDYPRLHKFLVKEKTPVVQLC